MEELHCMAGFNAGNEKALQHIFDLFYERLRFFARGITQNDIQAEDVVQEAFIQLWSKKEGFNSLRAVKAFLYLAVKNSSRNLLKHDKVVARHAPFLQSGLAGETVLHRMIEAEVLADVRAALDRLPEGCREVIHLCYFEGLRNHEAARRLEVSINTIKTQKLRGLRMLRLGLRHFLFFCLWGVLFCHPFCPFGCF
ncbi:RNA polymerase sigma factor [Dinghuibacter silviterrae]|uniref:RNA polymerase sigma-70 factor (ECF subfamily) n=1 Tax=Dinghuibacter silviterrae TaxID=1539049 RepID=A0A4R8DGU9_9BACT|nr:sigma-70 family RNA polymerase sigma factor [Dinghuibacter silviterrae]TDW96911.1 RNA polymerase sigma-70 factor (ECF subfamily) [Dinghuibacter silviterrae]